MSSREPLWPDARERVRADVKAVFAPRAQTCQVCGHVNETAARACPNCGASYVLIRPKLSRRAKRRIGAAVLALAAAAIVVAILISPSIERTKRDNAARAAAAHAAFMRAELRRLRADQRLHRGSAAFATVGHATLVSALERAIGADARARVRAGSLHGPILRTTCDAVRVGPLVPNAVRGGYECTAVTAIVPKEGHGADAVGGVIGYPFWAIVDYRRGTFAWCKVNPPPGEAAVQADIVAVPPPAACDLRI